MSLNDKKMMAKLLTILGVIGLIYAAYIFLRSTGDNYDKNIVITSVILGMAFFVAGLGLMRTTRRRKLG